jgi:hypothetical protein
MKRDRAMDHPENAYFSVIPALTPQPAALRDFNPVYVGSGSR